MNVQKSVTAFMVLDAVGGQLTNDPAVGSFDAMVDPTFEIDPSFPNADDFDLQFSPGFSPSGESVPEPSTLTLVGIALASLGLTRCRRRT